MVNVNLLDLSKCKNPKSILEFRVDGRTVQIYANQVDVIKNADFPIYYSHGALYCVGNNDKMLRLSHNGKWVNGSFRKSQLEKYSFHQVYFS